MNRKGYDIGFLFDLDGVLIDSERRYTRVWQEIESQWPTGIPDFPRVIKGTTLHNILEKYYPDPAVRRAVEEHCLRAERDMEYAYMPGAEELLLSLKDMGVPTALVTSSDAVKMESMRARMPGIFSLFTAIVHGDMVSHGKPHPAPYLLGAELIGVSPRRCCVVEDSLTGIEAGHRAHCFVAGMTDTLGDEAIRPMADITLHTLEDFQPDVLTYILRHR